MDSYVVDVVLNVRGVCGAPPGVGGGGQVVRGVLPEGLFASRNSRRGVVASRRRRCIARIPQQVDVEGVLQGETRTRGLYTRSKTAPKPSWLHNSCIHLLYARKPCV